MTLYDASAAAGAKVDLRAAQRVTNPTPVPTVCRFCGKPVHLVHHERIYGKGRSFGNWPYAYACNDTVNCRSWVGLHSNTLIPLGTLANAPLREARMAAKEAFNPLWKGPNGPMSPRARTDAYKWLAGQLGIPVEQCHISWFDEDACWKTVEICEHGKP